MKLKQNYNNIISITNSLYQQIPKRTILKCHFAKDIEHLSAQC